MKPDVTDDRRGGRRGRACRSARRGAPVKMALFGSMGRFRRRAFAGTASMTSSPAARLALKHLRGDERDRRPSRRPRGARALSNVARRTGTERGPPHGHQADEQQQGHEPARRRTRTNRFECGSARNDRPEDGQRGEERLAVRARGPVLRRVGRRVDALDAPGLNGRSQRTRGGHDRQDDHGPDEQPDGRVDARCA